MWRIVEGIVGRAVDNLALWILGSGLRPPLAACGLAGSASQATEPRLTVAAAGNGANDPRLPAERYRRGRRGVSTV
ncbi:hypothetical protein GCM10010168_70360 [Actinoplanes ianthinogenes]|uniref:Uncharacterized protein n=1 Tax=Actinoplanes ianthinogenes TaxID=122358 RepID=A0ABN6CIF5_9ACTN|nr:hypothetical protein Aiant_58920 [Actinoplanes ianthinogenes]GGR41497.1 hypothetical protein GCM10010168_70360 [Actinoplanes ianthinogenes]